MTGQSKGYNFPVSDDRQIIIDVRETFEFATDHVVGAVNIPLRSLEETMQEKNLPKDTPIIVYCRTGSRSERALQLLESMNFTQVENGINAQTVRSTQK